MPSSRRARPPQLDALSSLLQERHSVRAFLPQTVPDETISEMLDLAGRAPSWCNAQPWHVTVVRGAARARLSAALLTAEHSRAPAWDIPEPPGYEGVHLERRRASGFGLYHALGIARDDRGARTRQQSRNFEFFGAPHMLVLSAARSLGQYALVDCGAYLMTLLLAAESLGIAAVPQAAIAMYSDVVRAELELPEEEALLCGVSFGYADEQNLANSFRTERASLSAIARFVER